MARGAQAIVAMLVMALVMGLVGAVPAGAVAPQRSDGADGALVHSGGVISSFHVSRDGRLWEAFNIGNGWQFTDRGSRGNGFVGEPAAVEPSGGPTFVFVTDRQGSLWRLTLVNGQGSWTDMGPGGRGLGVNSPTAIVDDKGLVRVFVSSRTGRLLQLAGTPADRWKWANMGGPGRGVAGTQPAVAVDTAGRVHVFTVMRGGGGRLVTLVQTSRGWRWQLVGGKNMFGNDPTAAADPTGRVHVFTSAASGKFFQVVRAGKRIGWRSLGSREGGFHQNDPSVLIDRAGQLQVLVAAEQGAIWLLSGQGRNFAWTKMGTQASGFDQNQVNLTIDGQGRLHSFAPTSNGMLWRLQRGTGGAWNFAQLGTQGGGFGVPSPNGGGGGGGATVPFTEANVSGVWRGIQNDPQFGAASIDWVIQRNGTYLSQSFSVASNFLFTHEGTYQLFGGGRQLLQFNIDRYEPTQTCGPLGCSPLGPFIQEVWLIDRITANSMTARPFSPSTGQAGTAVVMERVPGS